MRKRRQWDAKTKAKIVLEGLSGRPVSELCAEYQINQNQFYQWRDRFLAESHRAFEVKANQSEVARLKAKTQKLQQIIGVLTVELKKTGDEAL